MTLEQAWTLIERLNDDANQKTKSLWMSTDFIKARHHQSAIFRKNFSELDSTQQRSIQYWIDSDDEFNDYFKCLSVE